MQNKVTGRTVLKISSNVNKSLAERDFKAWINFGKSQYGLDIEIEISPEFEKEELDE